MKHHTWSSKHPPRGNVPTPLDKIKKTLRKEGVLVASPRDIPKRATVGADAIVRHAEPMLELDEEAIAEVATPVADSSRYPFDGEGGLGGVSTHITGTTVDVETAVLELMDKCDTLEREVELLRGETKRLRSEVRNVTGGKTPKRRSAISDQIVAFLETLPDGTWLNPTSVGESIGLEESSADVADRMRTLARNGKIAIKQPGPNRRPLYAKISQQV